MFYCGVLVRMAAYRNCWYFCGDLYGSRSFHELFYLIICIRGQGNELTEFDTVVYVW